MSKHEQYDYLFKIVLVGDSAVGKTNLLSQLTKGEFSENTKTTIGVEFATKTFKFDGVVVKGQIWDTAGQERYRAITTAYYRGTVGALLVYDVTNEVSFDNAMKQWLIQLQRYSPSNVSIVLVGNKSDLEQKREVLTSMAEKEAIKHSLLFIETSALNGNNVEAAFEKLVESVYQKNKEKMKAAPPKEVIEKTKPLPKKKKKKNLCC